MIALAMDANIYILVMANVIAKGSKDGLLYLPRFYEKTYRHSVYDRRNEY